MNIGYKINYCSKLLKNKLNKELESEDITVAQFAVIKHIEMYSYNEDKDVVITPVRIAEELDMDKPTMSGIVNRLMDKGYIEKMPNPRDRRSFILKLTDLCIEKLPEFEMVNDKVINNAVGELNGEELTILDNLITTIIERLKSEEING